MQNEAKLEEFAENENLDEFLTLLHSVPHSTVEQYILEHDIGKCFVLCIQHATKQFSTICKLDMVKKFVSFLPTCTTWYKDVIQALADIVPEICDTQDNDDVVFAFVNRIMCGDVDEDTARVVVKFYGNIMQQQLAFRMNAQTQWLYCFVNWKLYQQKQNMMLLKQLASIIDSAMVALNEMEAGIDKLFGLAWDFYKLDALVLCMGTFSIARYNIDEKYVHNLIHTAVEFLLQDNAKEINRICLLIKELACKEKGSGILQCLLLEKVNMISSIQVISNMSALLPELREEVSTPVVMELFRKYNEQVWSLDAERSTMAMVSMLSKFKFADLSEMGLNHFATLLSNTISQFENVENMAKFDYVRFWEQMLPCLSANQVVATASTAISWLINSNSKISNAPSYLMHLCRSDAKKHVVPVVLEVFLPDSSDIPDWLSCAAFSNVFRILVVYCKGASMKYIDRLQLVFEKSKLCRLYNKYKVLDSCTQLLKFVSPKFKSSIVEHFVPGILKSVDTPCKPVLWIDRNRFLRNTLLFEFDTAKKWFSQIEEYSKLDYDNRLLCSIIYAKPTITLAECTAIIENTKMYYAVDFNFIAACACRFPQHFGAALIDEFPIAEQKVPKRIVARAVTTIVKMDPKLVLTVNAIPWMHNITCETAITRNTLLYDVYVCMSNIKRVLGKQWQSWFQTVSPEQQAIVLECFQQSSIFGNCLLPFTKYSDIIVLVNKAS